MKPQASSLDARNCDIDRSANVILWETQTWYSPVMAYRDRVADDLVRTALETFGAVILQGPRAVGKTTSGLQLAASSVRLDSSPNVITLAEVSPSRVLEGPTPRLIDEWQLAPTLWNAVRTRSSATRSR